VDTGAAFSILPHHSSDPATGQGLVGSSGSPIRCWGELEMKLKLAGQHFTWSFLLADVSTKSFGNTLNIWSLFYNGQTEPILFNIAFNLENFVGQLTGTKENIRDSDF
jgi:hypothetical protein